MGDGVAQLGHLLEPGLHAATGRIDGGIEDLLPVARDDWDEVGHVEGLVLRLARTDHDGTGFVAALELLLHLLELVGADRTLDALLQPVVAVGGLELLVDEAERGIPEDLEALIRCYVVL